LEVDVMTAGLRALGLCEAVLLDGVRADTPNIANRRPTEQRRKPTKMRGLKRPDSEDRFFFMIRRC
jgi:hypothetical protein